MDYLDSERDVALLLFLDWCQMDCIQTALGLWLIVLARDLKNVADWSQAQTEANTNPVSALSVKAHHWEFQHGILSSSMERIHTTSAWNASVPCISKSYQEATQNP